MRGAWSAQPGKARIHTSSSRSRTICTRATPPCTWRRQRFRSEIAQALIDQGRRLLRQKSPRRRSRCITRRMQMSGNPAAQAPPSTCLIRAGADPNASDKSGVTPLHRAVRTRCAAAVEALLAGGAEPRGRNEKRLDAASSRRSEYRCQQQRDTARDRAATADHRAVARAGATPDDKDEQRQGRSRRGHGRLDPRAA